MLKCCDEYYTELNGMPTGVSLFVWLPEERAKWGRGAGQADRAIRAMFGQWAPICPGPRGWS